VRGMSLKTLTTLAKNLRHNQTDAEKLLWRHLRDRQLGGHKFRRQHEVGNFIVDFACPEKMLIVEIDGSQHIEHAERDATRTAELVAMGYQVLRFWNNEVMESTEDVLEFIRLALGCPSP
jgi:very-short-patch-repair endonuclease